MCTFCSHGSFIGQSVCACAGGTFGVHAQEARGGAEGSALSLIMSLMSLPVCHGVMNALISAKLTDFSDCSVYCTHFPCDECKRIILQYGIEKFYFTTNRDCDDKLVKQKKKRIVIE